MNEITIKESESIKELKTCKAYMVNVEKCLEEKGVLCGGYISKVHAAIDRQIAKERIQSLEDEVKKLKNGEASLFETKIEVVAEESK